MTSHKSVMVNAIFPVLFLGCAASLQLISSTVYLNNRINISLMILFFFATSGIYLLNRILDKEDKFNNLKRWQFFNGTIKRSSFWITIAILLLVTPVIIPLLLNEIEISLIFTTISVLGLLYSVKLLPWLFKSEIKWYSIKDIPIIKSFIVCLIWSGSALFLAVAESDTNVLRTDIIVIFSVLFISSLNSTITSDVRDIEGDRIRRIFTIPVLIGPQVTLKMLTLINIAGISTVIFLTIYNVITIKLGILCCFILSWAGLSILPQYFLTTRLSKTTLEILVDSESIMCAICLGVLSVI